MPNNYFQIMSLAGDRKIERIMRGQITLRERKNNHHRPLVIIGVHLQIPVRLWTTSCLHFQCFII